MSDEQSTAGAKRLPVHAAMSQFEIREGELVVGGERLSLLTHRLLSQLPRELQAQRALLARLDASLQRGTGLRISSEHRTLDALAARLRGLDPGRVLARGYAWLSDGSGVPVMSVGQIAVGATLQAVLNDGVADVQVRAIRKFPPG